MVMLPPDHHQFGVRQPLISMVFNGCLPFWSNNTDMDTNRLVIDDRLKRTMMMRTTVRTMVMMMKPATWRTPL